MFSPEVILASSSRIFRSSSADASLTYISHVSRAYLPSHSHTVLCKSVVERRCEEGDSRCVETYVVEDSANRPVWKDST